MAYTKVHVLHEYNRDALMDKYSEFKRNLPEGATIVWRKTTHNVLEEYDGNTFYFLCWVEVKYEGDESDAQ